MCNPRTLPILAAALSLVASAQPEPVTAGGVRYRVLKVPPERVRVLWVGADGVPLRTFPAAVDHLRRQGLPVGAMMNGGIFEPGGVPSGLLVQDGRELRPVNRRDGEGNFYLKPNGIFMVGPAGAAVISTDEWPLKDAAARAAVQSGPLLLRRGKVHPRFNPASPSRLIRNGVGVDREGRVVLAATDFHSPKLPNLHEFAELFRTLGCDDALFLDGDLSQMRSGEDLDKPSNRFGSIIAVLGRP